MYECPQCAANLRYDIQKKKLYCDHCGTTMDPYDFYKEQDADESSDYEVTIFTCPQCGGELISEDTTAATFCSFCGSSTILDSRISKERRPKYIIPFSKTKENCKKAYAQMLQQAFFAPRELKDPEHIEKFRGIYMPYWVYSFEKKGPVTLYGSKTRRRGDYLFTKHYKVDCEIDASYNGIAYDASSTFSDNLSSAIAPFDVKKGKPFVPSFLSGFYADTSDVDNWVYKDQAQDLFQEGCSRQICKNSAFTKYGVGSEGNHSVKNALSPSDSSSDLAMFPVWFLSYRKDDRVAYAVVNGQTGKAAADLPVDMRKYLIGSLVLALPIFILLNLFFTIKPGIVLLLSALLAFLCTIISNVQISRIIARETHADDRGMQQYAAASSGVPPKTSERSDQGSAPQKDGFFSNWKTKLPVLAKPLGAIALAVIIGIINPAEDLFYYIGSLLCMATVGWVVWDIIKRHNLLTTHKLPQLNRRGGDDNA